MTGISPKRTVSDESNAGRSALILVDLQNDFVAGGALAVPRGEDVIAVANRLQPCFGLVVATQDWHPSDHLSFASQHPGMRVGDPFLLRGLPQTAWPDHCVQGTTGAELVSTLQRDRIDRIFRKGRDRHLDSYSGFFDNDHQMATGLGDFLKDRGITDVFVMGLATDYCVKWTALDAVALGFRTRLIVDGCRGVDLHPGDSARAIQEMQAAGVLLTESVAVVGI